MSNNAATTDQYPSGWMTNLSFRAKMLLPTVLVLITMTAVLGVASSRQQSAVDSIGRFNHQYLPSIDYLLNADRDLYQALVAERSYLLINPVKEEARALLQFREENIGQVRERLQKFENLAGNQDLKDTVERILAQLKEWEEVSDYVLKLRDNNVGGIPAAAIDLSMKDSETRFQAVRDALDALVGDQLSKAAEDVSSEEAASQQGIVIMLVIGVVGIALCLLALFYVTGRVSRRLDRVVRRMNDIAEGEGDLTRRIGDVGKDEIGQMGKAFNRFTDKIHDIVSTARNVAVSVSQATEELAAGNQELSSRTENQASGLQSTAASMDQLTATVQQTSKNARSASETAIRARDVAEQGGALVSEVVVAMQDIAQSSRQISDIIGVVDEIAFQTNLLALNAAVEAARAGEQGVGFAVVASEVRNLAQRSAEAAHEIKTLIHASSEKIGRGAGLVDRSGEALTEIVASAEKVAELVSGISDANIEQSAGINTVNSAINDIEQMNQHNASMVETAASSTAELSRQALQLRTILSQFRLCDTGPAMSPAASFSQPQRQKQRPPVADFEDGFGPDWA